MFVNALTIQELFLEQDKKKKQEMNFVLLTSCELIDPAELHRLVRQQLLVRYRVEPVQVHAVQQVRCSPHHCAEDLEL